MHEYFRAFLPLTVVEATTSTVAAAMLTLPAWQEHLTYASQISALLAPILGTAWIAYQLGEKLFIVLRRRGKLGHDESLGL